MAEGLVTEDFLPDLPRCKMTEQPMLTKSRPHTLSAPGISAALYESRSPVSSRCSSPRLRRSLDLIRISRTEWEQREIVLSSLRADKNELNAKFRQHDQLAKSHDQLQKACLQLAHLMGCTATSEISPETVSGVICPKAAQITSDISSARRQISTLSEDLARAHGELSSVSAKSSNSEAQVQQLQTTLRIKDSEIQQLRGEVSRLKQSEAHSTTMLQSVKDQISLIQNNKQTADAQECEKHNEITTLKQKLRDMDNDLATARDEIGTLQLEKTEIEERCLISDAAYEEVCVQLAETLNIDQSDSCDFDKMVTKVHNLIEECNEQRLKIESLTHLNQVTELDSKANRETILRLVADVKKHEQQSADTTALQQTISELKERLEKSERDRMSLSGRLTATQSSVAALQHEVKAKEKNQEDMRQVIETLKAHIGNKREEIDHFIEPYTDLCSKLRSVLKCSSDEMILVSVTQLVKDRQDSEMKLAESERNVRNTMSKLKDAQHQLEEAEDDVISQRSKVVDMEKQLETNEMLQRKLKELDDKYASFLKRLLKHLKVESGLVLVGEFAEDAALVRIDQLSKLESQAVAEKQSAYYSSQRKLKSCRRQLEAKEMQIGLLQRKVSVLETRLSEVSHKEIEWNATIDKGKRIERQIERLQDKIMRQQETIGELRMNTSDLDRLKVENQKMEEKIAELQGITESLQQSKVRLSQQLAEARHRVQTVASQDKERAEKAEELLRETRTKLEETVRVKNELSAFQNAVKQLMLTAVHKDQEALEHEDTLKQIETLILEYNRHREMSNNLQTSLKQLETGFKRGYQDTLTLLNTN